MPEAATAVANAAPYLAPGSAIVDRALFSRARAPDASAEVASLKRKLAQVDREKTQLENEVKKAKKDLSTTEETLAAAVEDAAQAKGIKAAILTWAETKLDMVKEEDPGTKKKIKNMIKD